MEYFCTEGDSFWSMTEEQCTALAVSELEKMGVVQKNDVLASHRERVKRHIQPISTLTTIWMRLSRS